MLLLQLPLVLYIVMVELTVGAVALLVFLDWRNEVKRGFLISYAFIYLALAGLTYLFQQNFATPEILNTYDRLDQSWTGQQALPLLLFFLLLIPYSLFLMLDKSAGTQEKASWDGEEVAESQEPPRRSSTLRLLRLISGGATVIAGMVLLFVMGMVFRPVAAENFGGVFTIAGFFAGAFVLGGVMTAMWLGHWYLVTPALSERPLLFSTTVVLVALVAQMGFSIGAGPTVLFGAPATTSTPPQTAVTPTPQAIPDPKAPAEIKPTNLPQQAPLSVQQIGWIHILVGFVMPLILGLLSWKLVRDRSFQSGTGMLYLVVVCTLAGEAMGRGLFLGLL